MSLGEGGVFKMSLGRRDGARQAHVLLLCAEHLSEQATPVDFFSQVYDDAFVSVYR